MDSNNWRVKSEPSDQPAIERTPTRSYQSRLNNRFHRDPISPYSHRQRNDENGVLVHQDQSRETFRKPLVEEKAVQAIEEGRRVWVGNMPYEATVKDIESMFKEIKDGIEGINMSVDPMTGRNPSYCFVDFKTKDEADHAMEEFNGRMFMGRPLGVKPGVKSSGKGRFKGKFENELPAFDRWVRQEIPEEVNTATQEGRRVWLGSLPRFESQFDSGILRVWASRLKLLARSFQITGCRRMCQEISTTALLISSQLRKLLHRLMH